MMLYQFILIALLLAPPFAAGADNPASARTTHPLGRPNERAKKEVALLRGRCVVLASGSNPIEDACTGLVLILTDIEGKELKRTRCSADGEFTFSVEDREQSVRIKPGSAFYNVASPTEAVRGAHKIELKLLRRS